MKMAIWFNTSIFLLAEGIYCHLQGALEKFLCTILLPLEMSIRLFKQRKP